MKSLQLALVLIITLVVAQAQGIPDYLQQNTEGKTVELSTPEVQCAFSKSTQLFAKRASSIKRKPYDVLSYDLFMDWRLPLTDTGAAARHYTGRNIITMRIDSPNVKSIVLEAGSIKIDSVFLGKQKLSGAVTKKADTLTITLPKAYSTGDTIALWLYYTQTSNQNNNYFGFVCYPKGTFVQGDTVQETIAYTNSEPQGARLWMPCNDQPDDKALTSISIIVPKGFRTASNGIQSELIAMQPDSSNMFTWVGDKPIPTYLMHIAASKYQKKSEWYKRRNNPNDSIEVPLFYWKKDEQVYPDGFTWILPSTVKMMETYSGLFGEYPFAKYGQDLLFPYFYGAMEHQTITSHHRNVAIFKWENVVCHELFHHWTGDKVSCATWGDIWLNEGGATFGEYIWVEQTKGKEEARKYRMNGLQKSYFRTDEAETQPAIYGIPLSNLFNGGTTYTKGGWVYHMLRTLVGDSLFFPTLRAYLDEYAYKSAETEDMLAVFEKQIPNPAVPFRTFFDQWLYGKGHPIYTSQLVSIKPENDSFTVVVKVNQEQTGNNIADVFITPLTLRFHDNYSPAVFDFTFINNLRNQVVTARVPFLPRNFMIDEENNLVCIKRDSSVVVSVSESEVQTAQTNTIVTSPNPVHRTSTATIRYKVSTSGNTSIILRNSIGQEIQTVHNGYMPEGFYQTTVTLSTLPVGVYTIELHNGENYNFDKMCITD